LDASHSGVTATRQTQRPRRVTDYLVRPVPTLRAFVFEDPPGPVPASEIDIPFAILGIGLILAGTVVYAFSTRFRTAEMGKSKDDADEPSDNG